MHHALLIKQFPIAILLLEIDQFSKGIKHEQCHLGITLSIFLHTVVHSALVNVQHFNVAEFSFWKRYFWDDFMLELSKMRKLTPKMTGFKFKDIP